jgi:1-acyl-sn-glycerol-3-phosphate acyltransferase
MRVIGLELVPESGPLLIVPNHDSQWDPLVIGIALRKRRHLRFLARAGLWTIPGLGPILSGIGQIPIERGAGDARALGRAVQALHAGEALCVFPEGKLSRGERLRARSGVGRLATWCPEARIVLCAVEGATDYVRFPRRPRVTVTLLEPAGGQTQPGEDPGELATRLLDQIRRLVPPTPAGRGLPRLDLELADLEDLRPAVRARALDRRAAVLHGHLLRVLNLDLLALLDAVALRH